MKNKGFTIVEMMVTLSILAIVLFIAVPSFSSFLNGSAMNANQNALISAFKYARSEAIKRGNTVTITQTDATVGWTGGFSVWSVTNEELRLWEAFNSSATVTTDHNITSFAFNALGATTNAEVITLCDSARTGEQGWDISILVSGAVYADEVTCG